MFESEYAKCEYVEKDRAVLHIWKKEAHYDDYRKHVKASLEMLKNHAGSVFIVDARNGFEDVKEDVEWGFPGGELFCDQVETKELKYFSKENKPQLFTKSHDDLWEDIFG